MVAILTNSLVPIFVGRVLAGLPLEQTRNVTLLSAIPCGFFGILFGEGFGATPQLADSSLIASTLAGILTLAGWILLLDHLH